MCSKERQLTANTRNPNGFGFVDVVGKGWEGQLNYSGKIKFWRWYRRQLLLRFAQP